MTGIEQLAGRALGRAADLVWTTARRQARAAAIRDSARTVVPVAVTDALLAELTGAQAAGVRRYAESPEFGEVALQLVLSRRVMLADHDELRSSIREQLIQGLRHGCRSAPMEVLSRVADVLFDEMLTGLDQIPLQHADAISMAGAAHLTEAAARNGRLLSRVADIDEFVQLGNAVRESVRGLHGRIRLPHAGVSRTATWDELYVDPPLQSHREKRALMFADLAQPRARTVVLGAPGAGKSTLITKLAHDVASGVTPGAEARVPFLLTLRDYTEALRAGSATLAAYLRAIARVPHHVAMGEDAMEYLLGNGRALVLIDGLDEVVDPALRTRVVRMVEGFAHRYPLVPIVATSRIVGYEVAPLATELFETVLVSDFEDAQVTAYANYWFRLDDATPETDRARLAESFLRDSGAAAAELRRNPLLLSLLCAMYSSDRYIPRNLALVYERCSTMLFEKWDSMRGIDMPLQFQGRVRYAVQHLAWHLLEKERTPQPRHRIEAVLADYLVRAGLVPDEAAATATQFLEFCTGRAWILADLGTGREEPAYHFTHRTFLEFFAAEHLVRTHRTGEELASMLRKPLSDGVWDVVGRLVLQLFDRHVDGGADELLEALLAGLPEEPGRRSRLLAFCSRALGSVALSPRVIESITQHDIVLALRLPLVRRTSYFSSSSALVLPSDLPLFALTQHASDENFPHVAAVLTVVLTRPGPVAGLLAASLSASWRQQHPHPSGPHARLAADLAPAADEWWAAQQGAIRCFRKWKTGFMTHGPTAVSAVRVEQEGPGNAAELREMLLSCPAPWVDRAAWLADLNRADDDDIAETVALADDRITDTDLFVLLAPYLETIADRHPDFGRLPLPDDGLVADRRDGTTVVDLSSWSARAAEFADRWRHRKVSVLG